MSDDADVDAGDTVWVLEHAPDGHAANRAPVAVFTDEDDMNEFVSENRADVGSRNPAGSFRWSEHTVDEYATGDEADA